MTRMPRLYQTAHAILYYYILLEGEKAEVVGKRIEEALRQDLGINLQFIDD